MWAIKLLMKIIVLPMILVIAVARLGVDLAIKLYGFVSFWLWVFLGIVVIMTVCQQNWMQTLLAIVIGGATFIVLFGAVWIQCNNTRCHRTAWSQIRKPSLELKWSYQRDRRPRNFLLKTYASPH